MRPVFVLPLPLVPILLGWALGWTIGIFILLAAFLALGFGVVFWWSWDAFTRWRRERQLFGPAPDRSK